MEDYLFLHISKTAGTSLSSALSSVGVKCSEHDYLKNLDYNGKKIITCLRNPYTRIHSQYEYFTKVREIITLDVTLKEFVMDYVDYGDYGSVFSSCYDLLYTGGTLNIDRILKFESIEEDFGVLCSTLNIENTLPILNSNQLKSDFNINLFDSEMIDHINTIFHNDFTHFDYTKQ